MDDILKQKYEILCPHSKQMIAGLINLIYDNGTPEWLHTRDDLYVVGFEGDDNGNPCLTVIFSKGVAFELDEQEVNNLADIPSSGSSH